METKRDTFKDASLENISKIYNNEKKINEKIIEIQRTNANLLRNQRDLAKIVISIDKQQQRIINQMNFIANRLDKLDKDTDTMKEEQLKMNEKLLQNSAAEAQNATIFRNIQEEIGLGNRENFNKMEQIRETVAVITSHFQKFNSTLEQVNHLAVDFLGDIRKELCVSKKASIIIREASPKLPKQIDSSSLASKSIHIPKAASENEQIKGVILKEINNQIHVAASKERINQLKEARRIPSKQAISLSKGTERSIRGKKENSKENSKDPTKEIVKKKNGSDEPIREDKSVKLDQPKEPSKKEGDEKKSIKDSGGEPKVAIGSSVSPAKSSDDVGSPSVKDPKPAKEADLTKDKTESKLPIDSNESNKTKPPNESKPTSESKPSNELKTASKEERKDVKGKKDSCPTNKQVAMLIVADNSDSKTKVVVTSLRDSLLDVTKGLEGKDGALKDNASPAKEPSGHLNLPAIPNESLPRQVNLRSLAAGSNCELPSRMVKGETKSETKNGEIKELSKNSDKI